MPPSTKSAFLLLACCVAAGAVDVTVPPREAIRFDGKPVFPIGFTVFPPPGSKSPDGNSAYAELASNGVVFNRCGTVGKWDREAEAKLDAMLAEAARTGAYCAVYVPELAEVARGDTAKEKELRRVVLKYRNHPAVAFWKASDEPEWGKVPIEKVRRYYEVVRELDPRHPVWLTQAPRGTIESLKRYAPYYDIGALDIYPVSYPPGLHSDLPNKNLSVVGDYAARIAEAGGPDKPFWMVLQVCFSGVYKPGRTLRFPTFAEQRYMTYQSIIAGARGLLYFGGDVAACWNESDRALGWNWSQYRKVVKPVIDELRPDGPVYPALIAPDSQLPVRVSQAGVEFRVREAGRDLFLLAAKREGETMQATFTGLPRNLSEGVLLFEEPRKVTAKDGAFTDWFGPNEVHVYRFRR